MSHNPTEILDGNHDVFDDGSVRILSAPGHTPGHQSLLVRLPETGPVVLSGDVAHFHENFSHRRVPSFNADHAQSLRSMDRIDAVIRAAGARRCGSTTTPRRARPSSGRRTPCASRGFERVTPVRTIR